MDRIRSPICTVVGHVDHGKSSILDKIRGTAIVQSEAGGITQAIGASIIPLDTIKKICGPLLEKMNITFSIPGILFIDTPGHAAFTNIRKRGGNLADLAILVVDINEGFKPQTIESVQILKSYKTPFIIAANKIDLISGWKTKDPLLLKNIEQQNPDTVGRIETKMYELVAQLDKLGFQSERFDRVDDYTKQVAIVPCCAKSGEGIPELLMVLVGLAQKYLENNLKLSSEVGEGTIIEVKEEKGLGKTMDVILFNGIMKTNDQVVIGGLNIPIVTKIRALFQPAPLTEMRDKKVKFKSVKEVVAATGVKISAPNTEDVVAGMPIKVASKDNLEKIKIAIQQEIQEVIVETEKDGIVMKADSLGSLEALATILKEKNIHIRKASVGDISKKDISDAESNSEKNPFEAVVIGFNVEVSPDAESYVQNAKAKVLTNKVIYRLIEDFEAWQVAERTKQEMAKFGEVTRPCKIQLLPGYVFRQSNPAIVGCEILSGMARTGIELMNSSGKTVAFIKAIEYEKESITTAEKGKRVAMSLERATVGRQIHEGDVLYSVIPEHQYREMKILKEYLSQDEIQILKEIAEIMRKGNPVWGI